MAAEKSTLFTAGNIAKELNASPSAVSKAIKTLNIEPTVIKGGCKYYSKEAISKVKASLK